MDDAEAYRSACGFLGIETLPVPLDECMKILRSWCTRKPSLDEERAGYKPDCCIVISWREKPEKTLPFIVNYYGPLLLDALREWGYGQPPDLDDLLQVTFVKANFAIEQWDADSSLFWWLSIILRNIVFDEGRREKRRPSPLSFEEESFFESWNKLVSSNPPADEVVMFRELARRFERALYPVLLLLKPHQKRLIEGRFRDGLTLEVIGGKEGCHRSVIHKRLDRLIQKIRAQIFNDPDLRILADLDAGQLRRVASEMRGLLGDMDCGTKPG